MKKTIYMAGGIAGLTYEEATGWRSKVRKEMFEKCNVFDPTAFLDEDIYDYNSLVDKDRAMRDYDLHMMRNSDLVLVYFNAPESIGTAQELALASEWGIPVIGVKPKKDELHPWLVACCNVLFNSLDEALDYICGYYIYPY